MSDLMDCVAVVDDEFLIAAGLTLQLEELGMTVCGTAATAEEAVALVQAKRPAVVLMDVRLAGERDGVDAAQTIHASRPPWNASASVIPPACSSSR